MTGGQPADAARATAQLDALRTITAEITHELDVEALLGLINRRAAGLLDAPFATVWFWDDAHQRLIPRAWLGIGDGIRDVAVRLGEGVSGVVAQRRAGVVVDDYATSPLKTADVARRFPEAERIARVAGEPLLYRDQLVGTIVVSRDRHGAPFSAADQSLLRMFADQAAIAIENALLLEREQRARSEAERAHRDADFLAAASIVLASSLDYSATLQRLAGLAVSRLADWCVIDVLEAPGELRRLATAHADPAKSALVARLMEYPPGPKAANPVERVLSSGRSVAAAGVTDEDLASVARDAGHLALMRELGIAAYVMVPLVARGRTLGAVSLLMSSPGARYSPEDIALAEDLGQRAGAAVDNARLYRESEAQRQEAEALLEVAGLVSATLDPDAVGRRIVESVQQLTGSAMAVLYRLDETSGDLHLLTGIGPHVDWNPVLRRGTATVGVAVRTRSAVVTSDLLTDPRVSLTPEARLRIERSGYQAVLAVPLLGKDRVIGALAVGDRRGRMFSGDAVRLVQTFAHQAAVALENARLYAKERAARGDAENANRLKDEFLAMLSHELRTPLTSIVGWTGLLRSGELDADSVSRALETIERNARLQTQLVEDLLDVSAIITGKLRLDLRPVELASVVDAAVESMRSAWTAKRLTLESRCAGDAAVVRGDPDRLQQIVGNLVSNAIKFTPGGGAIRVELLREGERAKLVVTDTGRGIAPNFLPHVFDHFRQAEATTTRTHRGLGLGLAIVRHLVELHGGEVRAASDGAGKGATFTVELPTVSSSPSAAWRASSAQPGLSSLPSLDGVNVLIVDDEPDARELMRAILERRGARVTVAASVADARELFPRIGPAVVASDIMMPGEDGYDLVAWLRARDAEHGEHTPTIALTAYAAAEDRERALAAGFDRHVAKPIEPGELIEAVAALLPDRRERG